MTDQNNAAQPGENLLDYAMAIAHERELDVTGYMHDSDGAVRRFKAAVDHALLSKLHVEGVQAHCAGPNCKALDDDTGQPHSSECRAALLSKLRAEGVQAGDERPTPAQTLAAHTDLLTYVLQDDVHNRLTPRVIDIAYTAFMQAKQPNTEDGGASDWFNDTKPVVARAIAKLREDLMEDRAALASAPVAGEARAIVYPPDGTESPFTVINLGSGAVQMGPCLHDGRIGGLWFGKDGQGMGHEQVLDRHAHPGETIAVVTFANVEGLDVMLGELLRCREQYFPDAKAAPQASEAVPVGIINAARYAGFTFLRHADGSYTLQPIVMATAQADKDGGGCAKGAAAQKQGADDATAEE